MNLPKRKVVATNTATPTSYHVRTQPKESVGKRAGDIAKLFAQVPKAFVRNAIGKDIK